jgi:hypothetical protein
MLQRVSAKIVRTVQQQQQSLCVHCQNPQRLFKYNPSNNINNNHSFSVVVRRQLSTNPPSSSSSGSSGDGPMNSFNMNADRFKNTIQKTINSWDSKKMADSLLTKINLAVTVAVLAVLWLTSFFRQEIRQFFINEAVIIGIETLSNEKLITQTQRLAQSVVQAVLSDKELMASVTAFLGDVTAIPETRQTLLDLTLYVLQHPQSVEELTKLSQRIVENLSKDPVCDLLDQFRLLGINHSVCMYVHMCVYFRILLLNLETYLERRCSIRILSAQPQYCFKI